jgi:hydroxyacylglutathione hydrolase
VTQPQLLTVEDPGLGNTAYLVDHGDNRALAVDASRDLRALQASAAASGLRIAYAADTHLHADFLSGAQQLAVTDGATVVASAAGNREFGHTGMRDGDELDLGGLRLCAVGTPGHTDEHLIPPGRRSLAPSTGPFSACSSCLTTSRCGQPTARLVLRRARPSRPYEQHRHGAVQQPAPTHG